VAKFPALPLWTDSWVADTHHLTRAARGTYHDLLVLMWRTPGCRVPNDDDWLSARLHMTLTEIRTELRPLVLEFCQTDGNWLWQKRLRKEFSFVRRQSAAQSVRAKAKWRKEKAISPRDATTGNAPTPTPTPTPIEEEHVHKPPKPKPPSRLRAAAVQPVLAAHMDQPGFQVFSAAIKSTIPRGWHPDEALRRWLKLPPHPAEIWVDAWARYIQHCAEISNRSRHPQRIARPENWFRDKAYSDFLDLALDAVRHNDDKQAQHQATIAAWGQHAGPVVSAIGSDKFDAYLAGSTIEFKTTREAVIHQPKEFAASLLNRHTEIVRAISQALNAEITVTTTERKTA
jgi:uncharacterized protein YdaU (DUF1376 family)